MDIRSIYEEMKKAKPEDFKEAYVVLGPPRAIGDRVGAALSKLCWELKPDAKCSLAGKCGTGCLGDSVEGCEMLSSYSSKKRAIDVMSARMEENLEENRVLNEKIRSLVRGTVSEYWQERLGCRVEELVGKCLKVRFITNPSTHYIKVDSASTEVCGGRIRTLFLKGTTVRVGDGRVSVNRDWDTSVFGNDDSEITILDDSGRVDSFIRMFDNFPDLMEGPF